MPAAAPAPVDAVAQPVSAPAPKSEVAAAPMPPSSRPRRFRRAVMMWSMCGLAVVLESSLLKMSLEERVVSVMLGASS